MTASQAKHLARRLYQLEHARPPYRLALWSLWVPRGWVPWLTALFLVTKEERALRKELESGGPLPTAFYLAAKWLPAHPEFVLEGIQAKDPSLGAAGARSLLESARKDMVDEFRGWFVRRLLEARPSYGEARSAEVFELIHGDCLLGNPYRAWAEIPTDSAGAHGET